MEPATTDRIQRMIDAEATERFPSGAVISGIPIVLS